MPSTVSIRHLARSAKSKVIRAARPGYRWQGFLLDNGSRIRRKGDRVSVIDSEAFAANASIILEGVITGFLEIVDPETERPMALEAVVKMAQDASPKGLDKGLLETLDDMLPYHGVSVKVEAPKAKAVKKEEPKVEPKEEVKEEVAPVVAPVEPKVEEPVVEVKKPIQRKKQGA
jgi:hypothetical protein